MHTRLAELTIHLAVHAMRWHAFQMLPLAYAAANSGNSRYRNLVVDKVCVRETVHVIPIHLGLSLQTKTT